MSNLSFVRQVGDGSTTQFAISAAGENIGYLRTSDIKVYVDEVLVNSTIEVESPHLVILDEAPPVGADILIRREMPQNLPYSNFERGNNFGYRQINNTFVQQLYLTQELLDGFYPEDFYFKQDLNLGGYRVSNLGDAEELDDAVSYKQSLEIAEKAIGAKVVQLSTQPWPDPSFYNEGTELKFSDTYDEYTLVNGAWVEDGNVGDEVDVTAASYLTLAQAQTSNLKAGQYVRLTDRGGLWVVGTSAPNEQDILDIGAGFSLDYQVERGVVELDHVGCASGDVTDAINAMVAKYKVTSLNAKTYTLDYLNVPSGRTVMTKGFATKLQQKSGGVGDIRIVNLKGDNIHFALEGIYVKGNISSDAGEQRHGIFINKPDGTIKNVHVGAVVGENIRGDVVYIGSFFDNAGASVLDNINVGNVYAKNVYRNGVSVTNGCKNVTIGDIVEDAQFGCGVCAIDVEPDSSGKFCENITFGDVFGKRVGIVGQFGTNKIRGVRTGHLDLKESRTSSLPAYDLTGNDFLGRCLIIRNADVTIASGNISNSGREAIYTTKLVGDSESSLVCNGKLEIAYCNQNRSTSGILDLVLLGGLGNFTCSELVLFSESPTTEFSLSGTSGSSVKVNIGKFSTNCPVGRFFGGVISNLDVVFTADRYTFQNLDSTLIVSGGTIVSGRVSGFNTALLHMTGVSMSYTGAKYSGAGTAGFHTIEDGCIDNGNFSPRLVDNV